MGLIRTALRKPISILVIVFGLFFFGINAVRNIKVDIFPNLNLPVIYISHPYGGFTHTQIAEMLDMPVGTVKGRMRLGLEKMRREMTGATA